jgi:hypothetical protein
VVHIIEAEEIGLIVREQPQSPRKQRQLIEIDQQPESPIAKTVGAGTKAPVHD